MCFSLLLSYHSISLRSTIHFAYKPKIFCCLWAVLQISKEKWVKKPKQFTTYSSLRGKKERAGRWCQSFSSNSQSQNSVKDGRLWVTAVAQLFSTPTSPGDAVSCPSFWEIKTFLKAWPCKQVWTQSLKSWRDCSASQQNMRQWEMQSEVWKTEQNICSLSWALKDAGVCSHSVEKDFPLPFAEGKSGLRQVLGYTEYLSES